MTMATIAFIGLGNMGNPMAANLVKAGHRVIGFDLVAKNRAAAEANGVEISHSGAAALAEARIIVTMLAKGSQVVEVYGELAPMAQEGSLFIDCSTIDVASSRNAHTMAEDYGHMSVDAPVNGNVETAGAGTLTVMVGGADQAVAMAHPFLSKLGESVIHCGGPGAGQAAKICNNLILGISMIGVAEAFVLASHLGLSSEALFEVASASSGQCWSLTHHCPVSGPVPTSPANHDYKAVFSSALMFKDLKLAQETALELGAVTPMAAQAAQLFALHNKSGNGVRDFSSIIELFNRKTA
jgi:3-hydroxyisobutyrate dehydrogenase